MPGRSQHQISNDSTRLLIGPGHLAYLRISEGCNHKCSFCTIPAIRGPFRSKPQDQIIKEAQELAQSGVVELNLVAQDTTSYERDTKQKHGLAALLTKLALIDPLQWIRLMYIYPAGLTDQLIDTISNTDKILNYLDIPIQHASDRILRDMKRPDKQVHLHGLINKLRKKIPDIILRTTVIVGFPGETDQEFTELMDFIQWAQFDALGAFQFYAESGTAAAEMPGQIPQQVKKERLERLMLAQQEIVFAKNINRIGQKNTCLIDSKEPDNTAIARFYGQAPEIDSVCLIPECNAAPGEFISVQITDSDEYDLIARKL
jgi:ribosomal protein S12 methylthiotransferase